MKENDREQELIAKKSSEGDRERAAPSGPERS